MTTETLQKLYLELANVVPADCISSREIKLGKIADKYGLALLMIAEGAADPRGFARETLAKVAAMKAGAEIVPAREVAERGQ